MDNIPIIGQPHRFKVHNWVSIVQGECVNCAAPLQLIGANPTTCPKCGTLWTLALLAWEIGANQASLAVKFQRPIEPVNKD